MPDISELMAIAAEKQKKKFSRGNRPDLLVDTGRAMPIHAEVPKLIDVENQVSAIKRVNRLSAREDLSPTGGITNISGENLNASVQIDTKQTQNRHKIDTTDEDISTQNKHKIDTKSTQQESPSQIQEIRDVKSTQFQHKINTTDEDISTQNQHIIDTKSTQQESPSQIQEIRDVKSTQFQHKIDTKINTKINTVDDQNSSIQAQKIDYKSSLESLSGNLLKLGVHIFESFVNNSSETLTSSYKRLAMDSEIAPTSIVTTAKRLAEKKLVNIIGKKGRGNTDVIIETSFEAIRSYMKCSDFLKFKLNKIDTEIDTKINTDVSSKLVNINNNILTNHEDDPYTGYEDLDVSALYPFGVFAKQVLDVRNQLRKASIVFTASQMQGVVDRFAKYCSKASNIANIKNKQAFFCSAAVSIAKGESDPFGEVLSSGDEALLLINKRRQDEMALKIRIDEMISRTEFEHWKFDLTGSERKQILGNLDLMSLSADTLDAQLYHHFYNFVWPDLRPTFKAQINEQIRAADLQKKSEQEQALLEKAQTYLKDPKWVNQAAMSHNLLSIQDASERQRKLESLAKDLAVQKGV